MNRRDILKLFGIGATVVPVLEGIPKVESPAKLVEVPKLDIVEPEKPLLFGPSAMTRMFERGELVDMHIRFSTADGVVDFYAKTWLTKINAVLSHIDVTA